MNNNIPHKPDGLADLEALHRDLLSIKTVGNHPFTVQTINSLITKVEIIIKKINHKPRLPLYQIEKRIIELCKEDNSSHGVLLKILFPTKFGKIDPSRLSHLTVNI